MSQKKMNKPAPPTKPEGLKMIVKKEGAPAGLNAFYVVLTVAYLILSFLVV